MNVQPGTLGYRVWGIGQWGGRKQARISLRWPITFLDTVIVCCVATLSSLKLPAILVRKMNEMLADKAKASRCHVCFW